MASFGESVTGFYISLVGSLPSLANFVKRLPVVTNGREKALGLILEEKALGPIVSVLPNAPEGGTVYNDCAESNFPIPTELPSFTSAGFADLVDCSDEGADLPRIFPRKYRKCPARQGRKP